MFKDKNINFDLTGSCTATATNPSTGECNESICPSGQDEFNIQSFDSRFNYYNHASICFSGCAPCDETDDCHRHFDLSIITSWPNDNLFPPPFLFINNNLLLLGLGNTTKQSAAC